MQKNAAELSRINFNDIDIKDRIGRGRVSVYKATLLGKEIAVKRMDCDKYEIPREVQVHSKLPPHPNILPLLGVAHSSDGFSIYSCMELADKSLYRYLQTERKPSLQQGTKWAVQIARAMHHIHRHGLAHRDLKSANVLLFEEEDVVKVCDFGCARPLDSSTTVSGTIGTYRWMAPEFNEKASTKVNQRCDVFSYAMVLYEIFTQEIPYSDIAEGFDIVSSIRNGERPLIPQELPQYIKELIQSCWKHDPHDRPTFEVILQVGLQLKLKLLIKVKNKQTLRLISMLLN